MRYFILLLSLLSFSVPKAFSAETGIDAYRAKIRSWVISHARRPLPTIAPEEENDNAADLVDALTNTNLAKMEKEGLQKALLSVRPWSDYYWPTYAGQIANRYADLNYNAALLWKDNFDYLTQNIGRGKPEELSPAEKYDLLVGDQGFSMTRRMIGEGVNAADADGKVEPWFGLCHGWAAASMMLPRPKKAVTVVGASGNEITFLPSDLKALATLLWANGAGRTRFVSGRCNEKKPKRGENSRELNPDCFDTNPATWHLSIVNQIGINKRSFVMDASAGYEVWNQPVAGYQYGYENPNTGESSYTLESSKVRLKDLKNDRYAKFRARETEFVVNIIMAVTYVSENTPTNAPTDSPSNDSERVVIYSYDLELDRDDKIVGGEWHSSLHPDFLWVPVLGSRATSVGDVMLNRAADHSDWNGREPIPASWAQAASGSAARGQPLARVVEELLRQSSGD